MVEIPKLTSIMINPNSSLSKELLEGLALNQSRYGYRSCPCRLAKGTIESDRDIVCPCVYRDQDVAEYGSCYCGLFVSASFVDSGLRLKSIPERRKKHGTY